MIEVTVRLDGATVRSILAVLGLRLLDLSVYAGRDGEREAGSWAFAVETRAFRQRSAAADLGRTVFRQYRAQVAR